MLVMGNMLLFYFSASLDSI